MADLRAIARLTDELAAGSAPAAEELRAAMARVGQQAPSCGDRQLRHFLQKHSYAKALEYLEHSTV
jgi:hypothetical protein